MAPGIQIDGANTGRICAHGEIRQRMTSHGPNHILQVCAGKSVYDPVAVLRYRKNMELMLFRNPVSDRTLVWVEAPRQVAGNCGSPNRDSRQRRRPFAALEGTGPPGLGRGTARHIGSSYAAPCELWGT